MRRMLLALMMAATLCVPTLHIQAGPRRPDVSPLAARIVIVANRERTAAGLKPLTINPVLMTEAQRFSRILAALGRLSHRGTDGSTPGQRLTKAGYRWSFYGENLAGGQESAEEVVAAWMASPPHRANILSPKAREIGVGHTFRANDPARFFDYYTMEVARTR